MTWNAIIVIVVVILTLIALYKEVFPPVLTFALAIIIFYFTGILNINEILSGLANENVILIFLLILTSDIVKKTSIMDNLIFRILHPKLSVKSYLGRLSGLVSFFSAWVNNTPLVAFMIPYVYEWAKKKGISPSKVMLPLSYAAILGGTVTLIGTSTNLIVNGLAMEEGLPSLNIFDFSWVGVPMVIVGTLYIYIFGQKLLPSRKDILSTATEQSREYLVETIVPQKSKIIGRSVEVAKLRNLKGLYLAQIIRGEQIIAPVSPKESILEGDRLFFAGDTAMIIEMVEGNKNLALPYGDKMIKQEKNDIIEVILTNNSLLHNQTAKSSNFRKKYDAAIIAIQRHGEKLQGKIGEITLKAGDLLLLVAGQNFISYSENEQDFFVTSRIKQIEIIPQWKKTLFLVTLLTVFVLSVIKVLPLLLGLLMVIALCAIIKMVRFSDLRRGIDLNLLFILVLALALGKAISNSGVAGLAANTLINIANGNPFWILVSIYIITNLTTMLVTNAAAVAITFPVAFAAVSGLEGIPMTPFVLAVAFAGSAEFITPFGYQTNLMVYGPGGYQFKDYIKFGLPLTLIYMILVVGILSYLYRLY